MRKTDAVQTMRMVSRYAPQARENAPIAPVSFDDTF